MSAFGGATLSYHRPAGHLAEDANEHCERDMIGMEPSVYGERHPVGRVQGTSATKLLSRKAVREPLTLRSLQ